MNTTKEVKEISELIKNGCNLYCLPEYCQKYLWYYEINKHLSDAKRVLQNYMDEEYHLTKNKKKGKRQKTKTLDIESKLYIELFWKLYKNSFEKLYENKTEKMFFKELLSNNDIDKIWNVLSKKDNRLKNLDKHIIQSSVDEWLINFEHTRCINDLNLEKLHTAMKVVKECSNIPKHSIIESMQEVLSPQALSEIIFLYNEYNDNGFFFMGIAQIRKALVTGTISSYTIGKNLEIFNQKYEYNLSQLTTYLNGVEDLYNRYTDTLNDIEQALNSK